MGESHRVLEQSRYRLRSDIPCKASNYRSFCGDQSPRLNKPAVSLNGESFEYPLPLRPAHMSNGTIGTQAQVRFASGLEDPLDFLDGQRPVGSHGSKKPIGQHKINRAVLNEAKVTGG